MSDTVHSPEISIFREIDDEWQRWISENLLMSASQESIIETMLANGFSRTAVMMEVDRAVRSPYLRGAMQLSNRLKKRDWNLAIYRKSSRMRLEAQTVPIRASLSREAFFDQYYTTNLPVVITGMMDKWPAMRKWNLDFFARHYGDQLVEVQMDRNKDNNYELERGKHAGVMQFREMVDKVRHAVTNDFYMTANNTSNNKKTLAGLWNDILPLDEYLDTKDPTAGFLWFGPRGTITPFHHDLTNNFMAQVMGRKRVKLVPSWDLPLMQNNFNVYSTVDGRSTPPTPRPESLESAQVFEVILNPGDLLFIPIGWMHFVEGLEISVTMSFTNFLYDNDFVSFYSTYDKV